MRGALTQVAERAAGWSSVSLRTRNNTSAKSLISDFHSWLRHFYISFFFFSQSGCTAGSLLSGPRWPSWILVGPGIFLISDTLLVYRMGLSVRERSNLSLELHFISLFVSWVLARFPGFRERMLANNCPPHV